MSKVKYNKKSVWSIFEKEFLNNEKYSLTWLSQYLNIHIGTIKRWILLKEVPPQYFRDLNKLLNEKYKLDVSEEELYKIYDQFFTNSNDAKYLITQSLKYIKKNFNIDINDYTLIEPSAGNGSFYNNFPKEFKKIGLDIDPKCSNIKKMDFFDFEPKDKKNIVIGNPPFGLRGQLALKFINKSCEFADFICFVLPPLFNSNGKGSPMLRINKEYYLAKEFPITNKFLYPNGKTIIVNAIFQIWTKVLSEKVMPIKPPTKKSEWIKIYALSNGKTASSKRNVNMIDKCDFYLPSTTFTKIFPAKTFNELPNKRGYGIVILKNKEKIKKALSRIEWSKISFKSTNGANNLRSQLIIDALEEEVLNDSIN